MRNFLPRRKVLNIQYSPRYEPSGAEGSPVRKKGGWRDRRSLVHGGISFFLFSILCHDSLKTVGTVYPIKDLVDRRTRKKVKGWKDDVEENDEGEENREEYFYSQCAWEPTRVSFSYLSLPTPFIPTLPTFHSASPPTRHVERPSKRVRCFRWIDSRVLPLCKLPSRLGTLSPVARHRHGLAKPVDSTSALATNQRS